MGTRRWDVDEYDDNMSSKTFDYSRKAMNNNLGVHPSLDPKSTDASGSKIRLSLDPDTGVHTVPITICIDVTGSGNTVPGIVR